ncbi:MAG TPA: hypothetical protein VHP33_16635 [Polyangiaceae bacterium]|nr:hypothetical protein [Polyangiaceae bacterium]
MRSWVGSAGVACLLFACGPKPEAAAPPQPKVIETPPVAPVADVPDLSPVAKPAELVVVGRIARPRVLAETLAKWSSLPVKLEDMIPSQARQLSRAVLWEAPVEMLVALDAFGEGKVPPPLYIGSVGLKSLDEALSVAEAIQLPTRKLAPGVFRVGDFPDGSCAIAVSLGTAPARLICGNGTKDVDTLLPYATRGLPSEPQTGADFELSLDAKPIQDHYGRDVATLRLFAGVAQQKIALDSPQFDRALQDAIYGGVDEVINLFNDLDRIRLEARIDSTRNVLAGSGELRLKGSSSWLAGTFAAIKPTAIPPTLPRLPPEATLASYNTSLPAERYAALGRIVGELAAGLLEHQKLPEATRKRVKRLADGWFSNMPETFGFAVSPSQGYLHPDTMITRLSEKSPRALSLYGDFFGLMTDPAIKRWAKTKLSVDEKIWPKVTKKPIKLAGFKTPGTLFEVTVDLKALAASSDSVVKTIKKMFPGADGKQRGVLSIIVQPDGDFTYVLSGDDTKEMARVMAEHRKGEPGATLVKPARTDKIVVAGFLTLSYLAHTLERSAEEPKVGKAVAAAPNHGTTPIPFSTTTGPGSARFDFEVPAAVFSDATSAVMTAGPALKDAFDKR